MAMAKGGALPVYGFDYLDSIENPIGTNADDDIHGSDEANRLEGRDGDDLIAGRGGGDTILGGNGEDTLNGRSGSDSILGKDGDDGLNGGSGDDTLVVGGDDDLIIGGSNGDVLTGGAGADGFVFELYDGGVDVIIDFEIGTDWLGVSGYLHESMSDDYDWGIVAVPVAGGQDVALVGNKISGGWTHFVTLENVSLAAVQAALADGSLFDGPGTGLAGGGGGGLQTGNGPDGDPLYFELPPEPAYAEFLL